MTLQYRAIARVVKTHGKKGEVVVVPVHGLPPLLKSGMEVHIVPPDLKGPRSRQVLKADAGASGQLIALKGVSSISDASNLVSKTLLAQISDLPQDFELQDKDLMKGRSVVDATFGLIGTIQDVLSTQAHDIWVVEGSFGEVMIPAVKPIVLSTDVSTIKVDLPDGLIQEGE